MWGEHEDLGTRWEQKLINTHGLWKKVDINPGDAERGQPSIDTQTTPPALPVLPSVQTKPWPVRVPEEWGGWPPLNGHGAGGMCV